MALSGSRVTVIGHGAVLETATCETCGWSYALEDGLCREVSTGKDG